MTPNDYIEKAKHAIATDQPMLAMLYMSRGLEVLESRRREYLKSSVAGTMVLLGEDINAMANAFVTAMAPAMAGAAQAFDSFHHSLLKAYDDEFWALVSE